MLLKWKANNQLELYCNEMMTQYSQLVNRLYVYTDVFDLTSVLRVAFSKFNEATQQWEAIDESTTELIGTQYENSAGYIYQCTIPSSVLEEVDVVALVLTAQRPAGYTNGNGDTVYQVFSSGLYKFYIERTFDNGQLPIPENFSQLVQQVQNLDTNVIYANQFQAVAETLANNQPATAVIQRNTATGMTTLHLGLPRGEQGVQGRDGEQGRDGYGVVGTSVVDGNLIIETAGVDGVDFTINANGDLVYEF